MLAIEVRISGGIFLFSLTYWSNCWSTARRSASISGDLPSDSAASTGVPRGGEVGIAVGDLGDARALLAFDQHLHGAVGQLQHLQDGGDAADFEHVGDRGLVLGGGFLGHQHDAPLGFHRGFQRLDALGAADEQRDDHVGEHHHVPQRQERQVTSGQQARGCPDMVILLVVHRIWPGMGPFSTRPHWHGAGPGRKTLKKRGTGGRLAPGVGSSCPGLIRPSWPPRGRPAAVACFRRWWTSSTTTLSTLLMFGSSNMVSISDCSRMERRPRAPVLRASALRAIAFSALGEPRGRRLPWPAACRTA